MLRQIAAGQTARGDRHGQGRHRPAGRAGPDLPGPLREGLPPRRASTAPWPSASLKRSVADADLASGDPYLPAVPAADAASAWRSSAAGRPAGGRLLPDPAGPRLHASSTSTTSSAGDCGGKTRERLPRDVLDGEIAQILRLGVELRRGMRSRPRRGPGRTSAAVRRRVARLRAPTVADANLPLSPSGEAAGGRGRLAADFATARRLRRRQRRVRQGPGGPQRGRRQGGGRRQSTNSFPARPSPVRRALHHEDRPHGTRPNWSMTQSAACPEGTNQSPARRTLSPAGGPLPALRLPRPGLLQAAPVRGAVRGRSPALQGRAARRSSRTPNTPR